jgi:hypothetical protein
MIATELEAGWSRRGGGQSARTDKNAHWSRDQQAFSDDRWEPSIGDGGSVRKSYASCSLTTPSLPRFCDSDRSPVYRNPNWKMKMKGSVPKIAFSAA